MFKGFRDFILRGNVVDLAVAVILGAAFNAIVTSLVGDVLNPIIAATIGKPDFSSVILHVGTGTIKVGNFLNAVVSFLIVASVVYLAIVVPMNAVMARMKKPGSRRAHNKILPRMPERHSAGSKALCPLRTTCGLINERFKSLTPSRPEDRFNELARGACLRLFPDSISCGLATRRASGAGRAAKCSRLR